MDKKTSIKAKIIISFLAVVAICNVIVALNVMIQSKSQLTKASEEHLMYVSKAISDAFYEVNEKEFKMLTMLSALPFVKDETISIKEKFDAITEIKLQDPSYIDITILTKDGMAIAGSTGEYISFAERDYYKVPMTGKRFMTDPFINKVTHKMSTFYAVPVKNKEGEVINVVFCVVDGYKMCNMVKDITVGKSSHPIAFNKKTLKVTACADKSVLDNGEDVTNYLGVKTINDIFNEGVNKESGFGYYKNKDGKNMVAFYHVIAGSDWVAMSCAPTSDFQEGVVIMIITILVIFFVAFVIMGVFCFILMGKLFAPLDSANSAVMKMATGDADLTKRVEVTSHDEVGAICSNINSFTQKLQSIIGEIKATDVDLSNYGDILGKVASENSNFVKSMALGIVTVEDVLNSQVKKVDSAVDGAKEISSSIERLRIVLEDQENGIKNASEKTCQLIDNITQVTQSAQNVADEFVALQGDIKNGLESERRMNSQITKIEEQSQLLTEANKVIAGIAEQTNLLAMNASIEAAHAGKTGQGFAVVAAEIRKLSENSQVQSSNIGKQLEAILESISGVVGSAKEFDKVFNNISSKVSKTADLVNEVKDVMDKQSESGKIIGNTLNDMNNATKQVRVQSDEVDKSRHRIKSDVKSTQEMTITARGSISDIKNALNNIETGDKSLSDATQQIATSISRINSQIEKFKV